MSFVDAPQLFTPYVEGLTELLFKLISDCSSLDSRTQVMNVIRQIVETLEGAIGPAVNTHTLLSACTCLRTIHVEEGKLYMYHVYAR